MPPKDKLTRRAKLANAKAEGKFSLDIITGAQNLATLSPQDLFDRERPQDIQAACKMAREWHKNSWFVETIVLLWISFYNFGLQITPKDGSKGSKAKVKKWLEDEDNASKLHRYIQSVWAEWLTLDNVVSFWREENPVTPYLLLPERCKYSDAMGIEKMTVMMDLKKDQLTVGGKDMLSAKEMQRYLSNKIELSENFDEFFRVLTRGYRGQGMGIPRLYRAFRTLSQCESMEVGENMLAYGGRLVLRFHRLGFEVKSAANAMKQSEYLWKKKRADGIENFFRGVAGFAETTGQFDHKIDYIWPDPKLYDAKKWDSVINRLLWWAGPVGFMMLSKSVSPFLLGMFKTQAKETRGWVKRHLEQVINRGFDIGVPIKVSWNDRPFADPRLAWQMVKDLMQQGPLSLTTALEEGDFDPEFEKERKVEESSEKNNPALLPKFDPNHGNRPGQPGRKPGAKNGEGENPS